MADEKSSPTAEEQQVKPKMSKKTLIIIAGVLILEGATIAIVKMLSGGPKPSEAAPPIEVTETAPSKEKAEIVLCSNMQVDNWVGGRSRTIVTLEVVLKTEKANQEALTAEITANATQIKDRIRVLVGSAQPDNIRDPQLQVIKREIKAALSEIIDGSKIDEILIPTWQSFIQD